MSARLDFGSWLNRYRIHLPTVANNLIDDAADFLKSGLIDPIASARVLAGRHPLPPSPPALESATRVLVAPLNFAGQGFAWAQAINQNVADTSATNLSIERPGDFQFLSDVVVPHAIQMYHHGWQARESIHIPEAFTHLLVEAESAIFGRLFRNDPERERSFFIAKGLSLAYVCHGSDIRSPARHRETTPFSPFADPGVYTGRTQRRVDRNRRFLERANAPVFLSTPDLLNDYPRGVWLPVVVDQQRWRAGSGNGAGNAEGKTPPKVIHIPSRASVKGTHLIQGQLRELVHKGIIDYRTVTGVTSDEVHKMVLGADIVLDQFRLGSYGVAACEAMAAGKVVVGHVAPSVRRYIRQETGAELPIVEADPASVGQVLDMLARDPGHMRTLGAAGQVFVDRVHSGALSAQVLERSWLNPRTQPGDQFFIRA